MAVNFIAGIMIYTGVGMIVSSVMFFMACQSRSDLIHKLTLRLAMLCVLLWPGFVVLGLIQMSLPLDRQHELTDMLQSLKSKLKSKGD